MAKLGRFMRDSCRFIDESQRYGKLGRAKTCFWGAVMRPEDFSEEEFQRATEYLDPDRIRTVITHIGLFMLCFEQLRNLVVHQPRSFFSNHWEIIDGELKIHPTDRYTEEVLSLETKKDRVFSASLKFLAKHSVLSEDDVSDIISLMDYRNLMAHKPHKIVNTQRSAYQPDAVDRVMNHHRKIGQFWAQIEADTDPDFAGHEAVGAASFLLDYMVAAATDTGDDPPST